MNPEHGEECHVIDTVVQLYLCDCGPRN